MTGIQQRRQMKLKVTALIPQTFYLIYPGVYPSSTRIKKDISRQIGDAQNIVVLSSQIDRIIEPKNADRIS